MYYSFINKIKSKLSNAAIKVFLFRMDGDETTTASKRMQERIQCLLNVVGSPTGSFKKLSGCVTDFIVIVINPILARFLLWTLSISIVRE